MTKRHRPRRSVLYMPGVNARALEKSRTLPADALIFDLEDAVAPDAKLTARNQVIQTVEAGGYGKREVMIRTNGLNTPWGYDDLVAAAKAGADAVLLPKVESAEMVRQAESVLESHGAPSGLAIWCMMETPRGMLHAEEIADILDVDVVRPKVAETTALGAAYAAGLAVGFWASEDDIRNNWGEDKRWSPQMDAAERDRLYRNWKKAVSKTLDWVDDDVC